MNQIFPPPEGGMEPSFGGMGDRPAPTPPRTGWIWVKLPSEKPIVAYFLAVITVIVFVLQLASQFFFSGVDLPLMVGAKVNDLIARGELWRLITPMFLHGSFLHIGFNMYALLVLGPGLERHYGNGRFTALYFLAGFSGNVMSFLLSKGISVGSSTAIFGLLGAEAVFLYQNRKIFGESARRGLINMITIAVINLAISLTPGIDLWGHMGGLIGGTLFAWLGGPVFQFHGLPPQVTLVDQHDSSDATRAGLVIGALFGLVTIAKILWG